MKTPRVAENRTLKRRRVTTTLNAAERAATRVEPVYRRIGARIQTLRIRCGLTQAALGGLLDPPQTRASVANIESAKQRLLAHTALQIAAALNEPIGSVLETPAIRKVRRRL